MEQSDWFTVPTITLTSSFILEAQLSTTSALAQYVLGNNTDDNGYVRVNATTGVIAVNFNSTKTIVGTVDVTDGKLHTVKVINTLGSVELFIDGVSDGTVTGLVGNNTFDRIGDNHTASTSFNGVISDVKITDGTDLIRYYKIDEDLSTTSTIIDSGSDGSNGTAISITSSELFTLEGADWIGAELIDVNGWTLGTGWSKSGTQFIQDGTGNFTNISQTLASSVVGYTYIKSYDIISYLTGTGNQLTDEMLAPQINYSLISGTGVRTIIFTSTTLSNRFLCGSTGRGGTIDNVSVKRILQAP